MAVSFKLNADFVSMLFLALKNIFNYKAPFLSLSIHLVQRQVWRHTGPGQASPGHPGRGGTDGALPSQHIHSTFSAQGGRGDKTSALLWSYLQGCSVGSGYLLVRFKPFNGFSCLPGFIQNIFSMEEHGRASALPLFPTFCFPTHSSASLLLTYQAACF